MERIHSSVVGWWHHELLLHKAELGFFHFFKIVTGWLVPSAAKKIPKQPGWYLPLRKIPLAENVFLQAVSELKIQRKSLGGA
jgi:hypothetical protein